MTFATFLSARPSARVALASAVLALGACASGEKKADTTAAAGAALPADSMAGKPRGSAGAGSGGMQGMSGTTGDADHDFLRMMSDHHKGLIVIAHMTKEMKGVGTATADASKLDAEQDKDLDQMMTMLEKDFKDPYAPKVMPEHQQMADALKAKSGKEYERAFYEDIIKHHQDALKMIDDYLPRGRNATLEGMAQAMKTQQQKEIQDFQQKVAKLGA